MKRMPDPTEHSFRAWASSVQQAAIDLHGQGTAPESAVLAAFEAIGILS
jgi:hypothetical protein